MTGCSEALWGKLQGLPDGSKIGHLCKNLHFGKLHPVVWNRLQTSREAPSGVIKVLAQWSGQAGAFAESAFPPLPFVLPLTSWFVIGVRPPGQLPLGFATLGN